jgi:hypothetical protein
MTFKLIAKYLFIALSVAATICGLRAARLWYLSSLPSPKQFEQPDASISDDQAAYIMSVIVSMNSTQSAVAAGSVLNKRAALWSAWTAVFGAAAALVSLFE